MIDVMGSEKPDEEKRGVNVMTEEEKGFTDAIVKLACEVRDAGRGMTETRLALLTIVKAVMDRQKATPDVVTDRVYEFCMTWLAGAITFNTGNSWRARAAVAFFAGAATVVAFKGLT